MLMVFKCQRESFSYYIAIFDYTLHLGSEKSLYINKNQYSKIELLKENKNKIFQNSFPSWHSIFFD